MRISASAPSKIHIAGEHSVVYGGLALMAPVEILGKRNRIVLEVSDGSGQFVFTGDLGTATMLPGGTMQGAEIYYGMFESVKKVFEKTSFSLSGSGKKFSATLYYSDAPKGTGNSASIPAALSAALYEYFGKTPSKEELFAAAYATDNVYHAGKSSGGDPRAVVSDKPLLFKKVFSEGKITFDYKDAVLELPAGTALLLVDSYRSGEKGNTGVLVQTFAKNKTISKPPLEMSDEERKTITAPFDDVVKKIVEQCKPSGSAEKLASLLEENHSLLRDAGVSSEDIEECLSVAKGAGALGGKLIGAGGNGGAVIILCKNEKIASVKNALEQNKFTVYPFNFASKGASVD